MQANVAVEQRLPGHFTRLLETRHVGHGRGRTDHAGLEGPQDQRVLTEAEPEVVSVDDHLTRHLSSPGF